MLLPNRQKPLNQLTNNQKTRPQWARFLLSWLGGCQVVGGQSNSCEMSMR